MCMYLYMLGNWRIDNCITNQINSLEHPYVLQDRWGESQ